MLSLEFLEFLFTDAGTVVLIAVLPIACTTVLVVIFASTAYYVLRYEHSYVPAYMFGTIDGFQITQVLFLWCYDQWTS